MYVWNEFLKPSERKTAKKAHRAPASLRRGAGDSKDSCYDSAAAE